MTEPREQDPQTIGADDADERLDRLLDQFEDAFDRGEELTPGDLCPDDETLQDLLARKIAIIKQFHSHFVSENADTISDGEPEIVDTNFVGGRFHAVELFGKGGLGHIFEAKDEELDRTVALKTTKRPVYAGSLDAMRFDREARITALLEHPGVVPVYGYGEVPAGSGKRPYYAMRLVKGKTLALAIRELHGSRPAKRKLDQDGQQRQQVDQVGFQKLLRAFLTVCETVYFAHHEHQVIHRDIKPINVILGDYGEVFLLDWGLAKKFERLGTQPESLESLLREEPQSVTASDRMQQVFTCPGGTLSYMSPEQADVFLTFCNDPHASLSGFDTRVGPSSDIFSLGATLFQILTGEPPIEVTANPVETAREIVAGNFREPRDVNPHCPKALEAICLKAMSTRTDKRYESARALADDISRWLADEPISAWDEPLFHRLWRWIRKHRSFVAAMVIVAVMAVLFIVAYVLIKSRPPKDKQSPPTNELSLRFSEQAADNVPNATDTLTTPSD